MIPGVSELVPQAPPAAHRPAPDLEEVDGGVEQDEDEDEEGPEGDAADHGASVSTTGSTFILHLSGSVAGENQQRKLRSTTRRPHILLS